MILKFWASWCPTCRIEMHQLLTARGTHPSLEILAVNADEPAERIRRYLAREHLDLPFPLLLDTRARVSRLYRISILPTAIFLDQDGVIQTIHAGAILPADFARGLRGILPSPSKE